MRIIKMITQVKMPWSFIKFSWLILKGSVWRSVWRICMWILGLNGLRCRSCQGIMILFRLFEGIQGTGLWSSHKAEYKIVANVIKSDWNCVSEIIDTKQYWNTHRKAGCREREFYSLLFVQAVASMYYKPLGTTFLHAWTWHPLYHDN